MSNRGRLSAEFKRGAVEQAGQAGVSCTQVARELGMRDTLLTQLEQEAQGHGHVVFAGARRRHLAEAILSVQPTISAGSDPATTDDAERSERQRLDLEAPLAVERLVLP